jgi:hypothetical protein
MLTEMPPDEYRKLFPSDPNPFVSEPFISLNTAKVDRIVRLVEESGNTRIGLVAGIKSNILLSPFSAPFGGFHFRHDAIYIGRIDDFIESLKIYVKAEGLTGISITLPPDIYHQTFNAKTISSLLRCGFQSPTPEITNWVDLKYFDNGFSSQSSREYLRQSLRNGLEFSEVHDKVEQGKLYELIAQNRSRFNRSISMTFDDVLNTSRLWPTNFFKITCESGELLAAAILYQSHSHICHFLFAGDSEVGRPLRAMDNLFFHVWHYYKKLQIQYIDLGISTVEGQPNEGLLRFKESHNAVSSLRYRFRWAPTIGSR